MKKSNKQAIEESEMTFGDFVQAFVIVLLFIYLVTLGFLSHSTYEAISEMQKAIKLNMSEMQKAIKLNSDKIEKLYAHLSVVYIPAHTTPIESEAITYQTMTDRFWSGELDY